MHQFRSISSNNNDCLTVWAQVCVDFFALAGSEIYFRYYMSLPYSLCILSLISFANMLHKLYELTHLF